MSALRKPGLTLAILSGRELIRRLDFNHITSLSVNAMDKLLYARFDPNVFLVDEEKLIFCGPKIDDGCKTT